MKNKTEVCLITLSSHESFSKHKVLDRVFFSHCWSSLCFLWIRLIFFCHITPASWSVFNRVFISCESVVFWFDSLAGASSDSVAFWVWDKTYFKHFEQKAKSSVSQSWSRFISYLAPVGRFCNYVQRNMISFSLYITDSLINDLN